MDLFNDMLSDMGNDKEIFTERKSSNDGLYRPSLKDAQHDNKYLATIRFLPNMGENVKGNDKYYIDKYLYWVDIQDANLNGYYDSARNWDKTCPLYKTYWMLFNSKNAAQKERANCLKFSQKYYSYVQIIEDEQHPELVGKIMIYPFGKKIKDKITDEMTGDTTGKPCNVYHPTVGKDFRLVIKKVGEWANYDSSTFLPNSPMKIPVKDKMVEIKLDDKGKPTAASVAAVTKYYDAKEFDIDTMRPVKWDDETSKKVDGIVNYLTGSDHSVSAQTVDTTKGNNGDDEDLEDFFNETED